MFCSAAQTEQKSTQSGHTGVGPRKDDHRHTKHVESTPRNDDVQEIPRKTKEPFHPGFSHALCSWKVFPMLLVFPSASTAHRTLRWRLSLARAQARAGHGHLSSRLPELSLPETQHRAG